MILEWVSKTKKLLMSGMVLALAAFSVSPASATTMFFTDTVYANDSDNDIGVEIDAVHDYFEFTHDFRDEEFPTIPPKNITSADITFFFGANDTGSETFEFFYDYDGSGTFDFKKMNIPGGPDVEAILDVFSVGDITSFLLDGILDVRIELTGGNSGATFIKSVLNVTYDTDLTATATGLSLTGVPEPATLALFGLGLAGLGLARRRPRRR